MQKHCSFIFDQNKLKHRKISPNLLVVILTSSIIKTLRMPFSILIHPVIYYYSSPKKLHSFFYKQHFYNQRQAEIGKKLSKR